MERAGHGSWSLDVGRPAHVLDHALFVRDAADLSVGGSPDLPGRLGDADDRVPRMLGANERTRAAEQWVDWWRACLGLAVLQTAPDGPIFDGVWHEELNAAAGRAGEAPEWTALAGAPELQKAVLLCQVHFEAWRRERKLAASRDLFGAPHHVVEHRVLAGLAERVAREQGVPPHRVRAQVLRVSAAGTWWHRAWPGVVVAAEGALSDERTFLALVEDAFTSGL